MDKLASSSQSAGCACLAANLVPSDAAPVPIKSGKFQDNWSVCAFNRLWMGQQIVSHRSFVFQHGPLGLYTVDFWRPNGISHTST